MTSAAGFILNVYIFNCFCYENSVKQKCSWWILRNVWFLFARKSSNSFDFKVSSHQVFRYVSWYLQCGVIWPVWWVRLPGKRHLWAVINPRCAGRRGRDILLLLLTHCKSTSGVTWPSPPHDRDWQRPSATGPWLLERTYPAWITIRNLCMLKDRL